MLKVALLFTVGGVLLSTPVVANSVTYEIDASHSSVLFSSKRFDVVNVYGRFNEFRGSIVVDSQNPERSSFNLEIRAESVDTNHQRRDDHLRSPDFLNAVQFPVIRFRSTGVRRLSETRYEVTGELTLHGVTRSITAPVEKIGSGKDPRRGTELIGFESDFTIKRSDFDMNFMVGPLSDEVRLILAVHGIAR